MSKELNGNRKSPAGSRVPTTLLPSAIRWERARSILFNRFGNDVQASRCAGLQRLYERRAMEETLDPRPT